MEKIVSFVDGILTDPSLISFPRFHPLRFETIKTDYIKSSFMKIQHFLKLATLSGLCAIALAGCDSLQKSGVSGSEGRIVTLADGRQVVVSGQ